MRYKKFGKSLISLIIMLCFLFSSIYHPALAVNIQKPKWYWPYQTWQLPVNNNNQEQTFESKSEHKEQEPIQVNYDDSDLTLPEIEVPELNDEQMSISDNVYSNLLPEDELLDMGKTDRFIIKYKNGKERDKFSLSITAALKDDTKAIKKPRNEKYDVIITKSKTESKELLTKLKQNKVDQNIEYIQPDYQLTTASTDISQENIDNSSISPNEVEVPEADTSAPKIESITGEESQIILEYNELLNEQFVPAASDFTTGVNIVYNSTAISAVTVEENSVILTLSQPLDTQDTLELSYLPGTNPIQDLAGNLANAFSGQDVNNITLTKTDTISPVLQKAQIIEKEIALTFNEELNQDFIPEIEDFTITINPGTQNETTANISEILVQGSTVTLILENMITSMDHLTIIYVPGEDRNSLKDISGNVVGPFTKFEVQNLTKLTGINDTYLNQQWGIYQEEQIDPETQEPKDYRIDANVVDAWNQSEGEGVIVAVLDTGIDITHEDLKDNIWTNPGEIPGNGIDDDRNSYIDDTTGWNFADKTNTVHNPDQAYDEWHGTHIAGIIAAVKGNEKGISGVAPKARIMPLQVFKNGVAFTSDIIDAISYAQQMGAKVANCSWGTTNENQALKEAMEESGLIFVCAAGNSYLDIDSTPVYPAAFNSINIITVASMNKTGNLSGFSNYGKVSVDVVAPGEEIISTMPGNNYRYSGGTSQAAAFVSGEVALIYGKYSEQNIIDIKNQIIDSCDRLSSLIEKVYQGDKINCTNALSDQHISNDQIIEIQEEIETDSGPSNLNDSDYQLFSEDTWSVESGVLTGRYGLGVAQINGKIYAIGGYRNGYLSTVEEYDPATQKWKQKAAMPTARSYLGIVAVNGKIYAIGGTTGYPKLDTVEEYDPINDNWITKTNMPVATRSFGIAVESGKIYVIGGNDGSNEIYSNSVFQYDPVADTWTAKASMPTRRSNLGAIALNGKIYAIGGENSNGKLKTVEEYDPITDTWSTKTNISAGKTDLGVIAVSSKIYAIGGFSTSYSKTVEEYNPLTNTWITEANMPTARGSLGVVELNGKIYAIGGNLNGAYLNAFEEFTPSTNNWVKITKPTAKRGFGISEIDGKIYIIGGSDGSYLKTVEVFDPITKAWTTKANMPTARTDLCTAVVNGKIYAIGGYNGGYLKTVEEFDPLTNAWTTKANMPIARADFGLAEANGKIYVIGGYNGSYLNSVQEYDPISNIWLNKSSMPTSRRGLGVVRVEGRILAMGGYNGNYLNNVQAYNPTYDYWDTALPIIARKDLGVVAINTRIYVIGGKYNSDYLNTVEEYEAGGGHTETKASMPTARCDFGVIEVNEKIYAIGGDGGGSNGSYLNTIEEYDPPTWKTNICSFTARSGLGAVSLNGKIYAIGGANGLYNFVKTVEEYDPETNTWVTKESMNTERKGHGVAKVNGKIYVIGGNNFNAFLNSVEEYDPLSNTWTIKASMPTARTDLGVAVVNGKIYAIGGRTSVVNNSWVNIVEEYDPQKDQWVTKASMPTGRYGLGVIAVNQKIYAIGGYNSAYLNAVEEYNPTTNTWVTKKNMLVARRSFGVAEVNGKIYAIGGENSGPINKVEEYDYITNSWLSKTAMITSRKELGVAVVNGDIYAIGGCSSYYSFYSTVEKYTPSFESWIRKASMSRKRKGVGVTEVNGKIYVIGGEYEMYGTFNDLDLVEEYDLTTNTWTTKAPMPTRRGNPGVVSLNGKIYVCGGGAYLNTMEVYDPVTDTWETKNSMSVGRKGHGVAVVNGKIYVIGGSTGSDYTATVEEYDPVTDTWSNKANIQIIRKNLSAVTINGKIYAIGGNYVIPYNTVEEYNPTTNTWITKTGMLTARSSLGTTVLNGKIYAIGGENYGYLNTVEEYNPLTDTWIKKENMSVARIELGVIAAKGKIYAIGGYNGSCLDIVEENSNPKGKFTHFEYDDANRLQCIYLESGEIIQFQYDQNGNLIHRFKY